MLSGAPKHGWILLASLCLAGCDGALRGGPHASGDAAVDPDARHRSGDQAAPADAPRGADDPCTPLPAACRCAEACAEGRCDNTRCPCDAIEGASFRSVSVAEPTDRPAAAHPDVNLGLRKRRPVTSTKGLVDVNGPTDPHLPPQLYSLFADDRVPGFVENYQVDVWDWSCNCPSGFIDDPEVTLVELATTPAEILRAPKSGYDIGEGFTAVVLYAAPGALTLKYTREDNVKRGYTIHLDGVCVEPSLQALYDDCDARGRKELPALRGEQPLGRAIDASVRVAIRDTGNWMDPRVRKDWWQGR